MVAKRTLTKKEIEEKLLETNNSKDNNNDNYDMQIGIEIFERFVLCVKKRDMTAQNFIAKHNSDHSVLK